MVRRRGGLWPPVCRQCSYKHALGGKGSVSRKMTASTRYGLTRRLRLLAMTPLGQALPYTDVIARPRRGRGNPYPVQAVLPRCAAASTRAGGKGSASRKMTASRETDCRVALLLAMTEEIEAQVQTIDHVCHCEAPKGPHPRVAYLAPAGRFTFWQAHGTDGREILVERYFPEIATGLRPSQ